MDFLFNNFRLDDIIKFRQALKVNKIKLLEDIALDFYKQDINLTKELESINSDLYKTYFNKISGKKKFVVLLHSIGIRLAYEFYSKYFEVNKQEIDEHILKYLRSEILHNGDKVRKEDISEIVLSFIISLIKIRATEILNNISITVNKNSANIIFNDEMITQLGFENRHLLNELEKTRGTRLSLLGGMFISNRKIRISLFECRSLINTIKENISYEVKSIKNIDDILKEIKWLITDD